MMGKIGDEAGAEEFADKALSAMRFEFDGYVERPMGG